MKHARQDYGVIQDTTAARRLAELILSMDMVTDKGLVARRLARDVLGITDYGTAPSMAPITTNGTTRLIPNDEPVFLLRGQDKHAALAVRYWAQLVEAEEGPHSAIAKTARDHADTMDAWPQKKQPDLPSKQKRDPFYEEGGIGHEQKRDPFYEEGGIGHDLAI